MEKLTTDMRFTMYNILYKRILVLWIFTAFMILLGILFSKQTGLTLFGLGVAWLICNALAIFLCMWVKLKLNKSLEKCVGSVNAGLVKHNLMLALDDRGKISCHKVNLCFIYMNNTQCIVSPIGRFSVLNVDCFRLTWRRFSMKSLMSLLSMELCLTEKHI